MTLHANTLTARNAVILIALLMGRGSVASAQQAEARLSMSAGSATDVTGVGSRAATVAANALLAPTPSLGLRIGASGTRFDAGQWSGMLGGSMSTRTPGRVAFTVDGSADFTTTSYQISYLTASVTPAMQVTAGPFTLFGGARGSRASTASPDLANPPLPPLGQRGGSRQTIVRDGATALAGVLVEVNSANAERLTLRFAEERGTVADANHLERQLSAALVQGSLTVSGYAGIREAVGDRTLFGGAATSVALSRIVTFDVAAGGYPANRLTGMAAGRYMSAGLSIRLAPAPATLPRPAAAAPPARGMTRLSIAAPNAARVDVAGDFNNWGPVPARRAANGVWYVDLRLSPGEYRYAFRIDGKEWRVPTGARTADDDFGGKTAWVTVQDTGTGRVVK